MGQRWTCWTSSHKNAIINEVDFGRKIYQNKRMLLQSSNSFSYQYFNLISWFDVTEKRFSRITKRLLRSDVRGRRWGIKKKMAVLTNIVEIIGQTECMLIRGNHLTVSEIRSCRIRITRPRWPSCKVDKPQITVYLQRALDNSITGQTDRDKWLCQKWF